MSPPTAADRIAAIYQSLSTEDRERFVDELAAAPNPDVVVADWEDRDLRSGEEA